jgi:ABC-type cobalt transport system substrate-binding protein
MPRGDIFSRPSALLHSIQATSDIFGVRKSVGAGLLANAAGQVRQCHARIFFAAKRAPHSIQATSDIFAVRKSVGAGLLANAVGLQWRC